MTKAEPPIAARFTPEDRLSLLLGVATIAVRGCPLGRCTANYQSGAKR